MQALRLITQAFAQVRLQGQPQREMQTMAERAEENHLPIAQLIARRFEKERAIRWQTTGCSQLPLDVIADIAGRISVEKEFALQPIETSRLIETFAQFTEKRS